MQSQTRGSNSRTVRSRPELRIGVRHLTNWVPRRPKMQFLPMSMKVFLEEISIWIGMDSKDHLSSMWEVIIQCVEGLNKTNQQTKNVEEGEMLPFPKLRHAFSPPLRQWCSWFLGIWTQTGIYTISIPKSWDFGLELNCVMGFPCSPLADVDSRSFEFSASTTA